MSRSHYVPSPPSRMPSVEDQQSLGISIRSGLPHRLALGSNIEGMGFDLFKYIIPAGKKLGDPFKKSVGINPFEMGMDLGENVIAPALMKVIPPKGRGLFDDIGKAFKPVAKAFKPIGKVLKPYASSALDIGVPLATTALAPELGMFAPAVGSVARSGIKNLTGVGVLLGGQKGRRPMPPMATMGSGMVGANMGGVRRGSGIYA